MKCPRCVREGKRSKVTQHISLPAVLKVPLFRQKQWDEDGNPIPQITPNHKTTEYSCSNGHSWKEIRHLDEDGELIAFSTHERSDLFD